LALTNVPLSQKLVKRLIYERHTEILNEKMDVMLENLRLVVENGFPAAQQAFKDDLAKWGKPPGLPQLFAQIQ
jgi:hypothetical protein